MTTKRKPKMYTNIKIATSLKNSMLYCMRIAEIRGVNVKYRKTNTVGGMVIRMIKDYISDVVKDVRTQIDMNKYGLEDGLRELWKESRASRIAETRKKRREKRKMENKYKNYGLERYSPNSYRSKLIVRKRRDENADDVRIIRENIWKGVMEKLEKVERSKK